MTITSDNFHFAATLIPAALEATASHLDGSQGSNRALDVRSQIAATTDIDALKAWLMRFRDSKTTFDNYRKEAERLLLWATLQMQKPLSSLTHEDFLAYQDFLADPQPSAQWVMRDGRKFSRTHAQWRPFSGPLSPASRRQAIIILNTLFSWLVQAGYLAGNPLSLSRNRAQKLRPRITRYLDDDLWQTVKDTIAAMPRETVREREHHARVRWLFSLLYSCGLRISEVAGNTMGGFFCRRDRFGRERWWLEILGKGNKLRLIPATSELMGELASYRQLCGLTLQPTAGESTPLLLPIGGRLQAMTRGALHAIVKQVFAAAAERIRARGIDMDVDTGMLATQLESASAHWLRHTAGSHMANSALDLRHVRDNLGHASIATTNTYLHAEDDVRHSETEDKHKIGWDDAA
jgi:integrase/recombinase XerD